MIAAGGERIPATVRDAVLARAARLSAPARRLLDAVAVVPGQVEPWLLEAMAGELTESVEECLGSGMLTADRTHIAFRHELARLAVEDAIAPTRRLVLHRAALAALAARGGEALDFDRLSHHAEAAEDIAAVLEWAPRAAERARRLGRASRGGGAVCPGAAIVPARYPWQTACDYSTCASRSAA